MKTLNALLVASTLTLNACSNPAPSCNKDCRDIIAAVGTRLQTCLRIDELCAAAIHSHVVNCMVGDDFSGPPLPGDDCLNMATEELLQCAK